MLELEISLARCAAAKVLTASDDAGAYVRGQGSGTAQQTKEGQGSSFLCYVCIDGI